MKQSIKSEFREAWQDLKEDFRKLDRRAWKGTLHDVQAFYMTREQRERLKKYGRVGRFLYASWCLLKGMLSKLSPGRSIALVIGLVLLFRIAFQSPRNEFSVLGGLIIMVILMLELKDKLLATDELREGRSIQLALMPESEPVIPGWQVLIRSQPANTVGGDLVDVQFLQDGRAGLALGDLAGKGLGAALMMARLHSTIRALAPESERLDALAVKLNVILCRDGVKSRFASLVYLMVRPETGEVRLFNAGHMPPVHVQRSGIHPLEKGGIAMGLTMNAEYVEQKVQLASGDLLIVYSDGLTEAINGDGAFFGDDRAMALFRGLHGIPAREAARRINNELADFLEEAPLADDFSLLVLSRN